MTEQRNYPLYQMLSFYWKKKVWFIIIPLICALVGLLASSLWPKEEAYIGKSNIFTGAINLESLTNPDQIMAKYGEHFESEVDIFVPSRSYIQLEVRNDNKEEIEKELKVYHDGVMKELSTQYDNRVGITETYVALLEKRVETLNASIKEYQSMLDNDEVISSLHSSLIISAETSLSENMVTLQRVKNDLAFFEKPSLVSSEINETPSYTLQWTAAGFVIGILLAIFIITLWQYIHRARKDNQHD
ncbi:hypothetical protein [Paenisporosarcina sp. NPDC076898]|uniref:hypothetical protein n=1 Tax=unclassified Paenisporosarcina TaxID=2642018 RepID=UPI003D00028D